MKTTLRPLVLLVSVASVACERPPVETVQGNFRGLGIEQVVNPRTQAATVAANQAPAPLAPVAPGSPPASAVFQNVQVLGDVSSLEFGRLMAAMTAWVSPKQGCNYCHNTAEGLASDNIYTKTVARRMIEMTRHINTAWKDHVGPTGVTCFTCHRGNNIPEKIWWKNPGPPHARGMAGNHAGQNTPAREAGLTSLPYDPLTPFLSQNNEIRVQSTTALPAGNRHSIKQTEWTYSFMIHISESLGVNCGYCHNTRSFMPWEASAPARAKAWYGIRMVRDLNDHYLTPLASVFPANRKGPEGDVFKIDCATCHQGVNKPLLGVSMVKDYPELARSTTQSP